MFVPAIVSYALLVKVIVSGKNVVISSAINPTSLLDVVEQSGGAEESFM